MALVCDFFLCFATFVVTQMAFEFSCDFSCDAFQLRPKPGSVPNATGLRIQNVVRPVSGLNPSHSTVLSGLVLPPASCLLPPAYLRLAVIAAISTSINPTDSSNKFILIAAN